ncbi:acyl--CoA ligase [Wenzhouxiangella sp. AB-CW3]|uniref:class I adenylate-forming enzyme family protein n=1 Tax=Wenzhouxiangella sp. AB-CW3 TaxID=2771012 RepID=UPI00168B7029|nr:class I adenylate-forming enzyme family protein [Wenzhouxiangella sp. AB-CW3]QOC23547.1 acyl--CoA ligase [Wenzhouxiangella sp. AB-CW3]
MHEHKYPKVEERVREYVRRGWWGETTLSDLLEQAVAAHPERMALVDQPNRESLDGDTPKRWTWAELSDEVETCARALSRLNIGRGDAVVVQLPNVAEFVVLYLALARIGAVISPVPVQYSRHELSMIAEALEPALFIGITRFHDHDLTQAAKAVGFRQCVWLGPEPPDGDAPFSSLLDQARSETDTPPVNSNANDIMTVCWTSGTTGSPKGVPRTHNQWMAIAPATYEGAEMREGDVLLNPFPFVNMASIGGFLINWLRCQGTLVLHHPLELPVFLSQIPQEGVTFTIAPPALLNMLLKNDELMSQFDLSNLRCIASGSAPLSPWMVKGFADKYDIGVVNLFGSNEGVSLVSGLEDMPDPTLRASYFPRFGVDGIEWNASVSKMVSTRLRDLETGDIITEKGQPGELEIKGATIFDHYLGDTPDNPEVFTDDGYFRTGDLFEISGDGNPPPFYHFVGRSKDIIIRGGNNISPDELDTMLAAHPALAEAATVGYPDEDLGERVCAFVVPKPGEQVSLDDITGFLREQGLAVFKLPERLETIDALPRNALGKVVRDELRQQL